MSASQIDAKVRVPRGRVAIEGAQRVWSSENGSTYHHLDCPMATRRAREKPHLWTKTSRWDAVMDGKWACFANCCHLHPMWDTLIIHEEVYVRTGSISRLRYQTYSSGHLLHTKPRTRQAINRLGRMKFKPVNQIDPGLPTSGCNGRSYVYVAV